MRKIKLLCSVVLSAIMPSVYAATQAERIAELERIALYEPSDWIDENEVIPTPDDAKKKFNLTNGQLLEDIKVLEKKYSVSETNEEKQLCRKMAVGWIGTYGMTNEVSYLKNIMNNSNDYAQEYALAAPIHIFKNNSMLISLIKSVVTNKVDFSYEKRISAYTTVYGMCTKDRSDYYIDDPTVHARIASFFLEQAAVEKDFSLFVDRVACELNPTYRHSQQRRDNLARLRPTGLTGEQAEIYDARQRDAQPKEGE